MSKLSISKAWDESKAIAARDGRLIAAVALAFLVLPGIILGISVPKASATELPPAGPWMAVALVCVLIALVGQLAVIRLAVGPHGTVGEAIAHAARRLLPLVGAVMIWSLPILLAGYALYSMNDPKDGKPSLAVGLGFLVLTCIGLFLWVRLIVASAVASSEDINPIAILTRSWKLTQGSWWRLFGFALLFGIGAYVLIIAVQSVVGLLARMLIGEIGPMTVAGLIVTVVTQVVSACVSVLFFVMIARIYVQLSGKPRAAVPSSGT